MRLHDFALIVGLIGQRQRAPEEFRGIPEIILIQGIDNADVL
jgi:hypothetical protein